MVSIYTLCDPTTGEVRYVGLTRRLAARIKQYKAQGGGHTPHLRNWLQSVGRNPIVIVLEEVPIEGADDVERKWIALLRLYGARLLNYTDGGEAKFSMPLEHRERLRQLRKAEVAAGNHNFFKPEVRARTIAAVKANHMPKPWSAEQARRMSAAQRGVPLTEEHKRKCSEALRGKKRSAEAKEKDRQSSLRQWADPEWAARMRIVLKKNRPPAIALELSAQKRRGVPLTDEHRRKVSDGQKATWTPERRLSASASHKGKISHPMTAEMKAKVSASLKAWYAAHPDKYPGGRQAKAS